jgi:SNF2 family DNA or RNA helicase
MSVADRAKQLLNPIEEFFVIANIETFRNDKVVEAFEKSKNNFGLIAVDEIHRIANKSSTQGGNLLKLKAPYKVAATGTLLVNSPMSCYVPLF